MAKKKVEENGHVRTEENGHVRTELHVCSLKVPLTVDEIADRADRAAQFVADRDGKEEERKAADKHAKGLIETIDAELRRLSNEVRTRSTYRPVEVKMLWDYEAGKYSEVRLDTSEVLVVRDLTESERQRELPFAST